MHLDHLTLTDFRSYTDAEFEPAAAGITVVTGANGAGKTNLIEAVAYLATLRSLRGAPAAAVIRSGCDQAVLRSRVRHDARLITIDAEVHAAGRDRVQVNGQPLRRTRDLLGALQVTVFSPDDLALVKAAPAGRREYLDDLMVALQPRRDSLLTELERVLKQRNALLKSVFSTGWRPGRPLPEDVRVTLDVWDSKLVAVGEALVEARSALARDLTPHVATAYSSLATGSAPPARLAVALAYEVSWPGALRDALTRRTFQYRPIATSERVHPARRGARRPSYAVGKAARASPASAAVWKRSAGRLASSLPTSSGQPAGRSGRTRRRSGGSCCRCCTASAAAVAPANGSRPASRVKARTPSA